jgi:hypothetical protein
MQEGGPVMRGLTWHTTAVVLALAAAAAAADPSAAQEDKPGHGGTGGAAGYSPAFPETMGAEPPSDFDAQAAPDSMNAPPAAPETSTDAPPPPDPDKDK